MRTIASIEDPAVILKITASADVNPDIDELDRLELMQNGDVIAGLAAAGDGKPLLLEHGPYMGDPKGWSP